MVLSERGGGASSECDGESDNDAVVPPVVNIMND